VAPTSRCKKKLRALLRTICHRAKNAHKLLLVEEIVFTNVPRLDVAIEENTSAKWYGVR